MWNPPQVKWIKLCIKNCIVSRSSIWLDSIFPKLSALNQDRWTLNSYKQCALLALMEPVEEEEDEERFHKERPSSGAERVASPRGTRACPTCLQAQPV